MNKPTYEELCAMTNEQVRALIEMTLPLNQRYECGEWHIKGCGFGMADGQDDICKDCECLELYPVREAKKNQTMFDELDITRVTNMLYDARRYLEHCPSENKDEIALIGLTIIKLEFRRDKLTMEAK